MKKIIAILLAGVLCLSTVACSSDTYEEDKESIMQTMNELSVTTTTLGQEILEIGSVTGAGDLFTYLGKVLTIEEIQDYLDEIANDDDRKKWEEYTDDLFGTSLRAAQRKNQDAVYQQEQIAVEKFIEYSENYYALYNDVTSKLETLETDIKTFKDTHTKNENHSEGVDLIVTYYLVCSEYAENVLEPSCTLIEFEEYLESYPEELEGLQKKIDLE